MWPKMIIRHVSGEHYTAQKTRRSTKYDVYVEKRVCVCKKDTMRQSRSKDEATCNHLRETLRRLGKIKMEW